MIAQQSPTRLLPLAEVLLRTSVSRSGIYAAIAGGTFPAPVKIGAKSAWVESEVDAWVAARIAERDMGKNVGSDLAA